MPAAGLAVLEELGQTIAAEASEPALPSDPARPPPEVIDALRHRWRALRAAGQPAGAQSHEMSTLRRALLSAGEWRDVYDL